MSSPEKVSFQLPQWINVGDFELLIKKKIGEGGFGSVYLLDYQGGEYAAKLYRMWEVLPDQREDIYNRIYQEYRISEIINSPYVVKLLSYQEVLGNPFLIMEYCEGGSLRKLIGETLDFDDIKEIVTSVCMGLMAMHEQNFIHRDIKPENILCKRDSYVITDFGISANLDHRLTQRDILGKARQVFATVTYSPPEQSNSFLTFKNTGPTNDIYALGVLLHEIVTMGKLPYGCYELYEEDPIGYQKRKKKEWNRVSIADIETDELWIQIIEKCIHPKISRRFQSAKEIIDILTAQKTYYPNGPRDLIHCNTSWCLILTKEGKEEAVFYLSKLAKNKNKSTLSIGRFAEENFEANDIMIVEDDKVSVSRFHATLEVIVENSGNEQWVVRDGQWLDHQEGQMGWKNSTNGTFVNGIEIDHNGTILHENDEVKVGSTKLIFSKK